MLRFQFDMGPKIHFDLNLNTVWKKLVRKFGMPGEIRRIR